MLQNNVCAPAGVTHRDQEWYDAEIAQKLQGKIILEIALFLFTEEKQSLQRGQTLGKKTHLWIKEYMTLSTSKAAKSTYLRAKASDKYNVLRLTGHHKHYYLQFGPWNLDHTHFTNNHNATHHFLKPESSHKGFHNKQ